jgi:protein-S-isoprenylcysteine O-methyltransferase Ste14
MLQTEVAPNQWRDRPIGAAVLEVLMHPTRRSTLALLVAAVVLFVLSASGQPDTYWASGPSWLGLIGWLGFVGCALLLMVMGLVAAASRIRHRGRLSTQ